MTDERRPAHRMEGPSVNRRRGGVPAACLLVVLAVFVPLPAGGQAYRVVDLGVGSDFFPTALNNRGQVLLTNGQLSPPSIGGLLAAGFKGITDKWAGPASLLWEDGRTT